MKFYEDIEIGDRIEIGSHLFTAEKIIRFATAYDPQRFHLSDEAAAKTHFGRLCASGWHTASVWMRLMVEFRNRELKRAADAGLPVARLGPSPGFETLKWVKPVFAGDCISYTSEVVAKRESRTRPQWGIVKNENAGTNQNGEVVFRFRSSVFVERRSGQ